MSQPHRLATKAQMSYLHVYSVHHIDMFGRSSTLVSRQIYRIMGVGEIGGYT